MFKDDSQLCYKIYNKIIWYTILFYAMCVKISINWFSH